MKNTAIVITTKVWRLVRNAMRPNGTATTAAPRPATGTRANIDSPAGMSRRCAIMARM